MIRHSVFPSPALAEHVRNYLVGGFTSLENHLPAIGNSQIVIYFRGKRPQLHGEYAPETSTAFVAGPTMQPRRFTVTADNEFIGITFRANGLQRCLGIPADLCADQLVPLENFIPSAEVDALIGMLNASFDHREQVRIAENFLLALLNKSRRKVLTLPTLSIPQMLAPARQLAQTFDLGPRQLERRFLATYGITLRESRRLTRFNMVLMHLLLRPPHPGLLTNISQDCGYTDQAHMIRDFKDFVGDTPRNYLRDSQQQTSIYDLWKFDKDELQGYIARL
jgi:AraC-like DNA-binding protein